ncbi:T9SS type A sorting domain-containing protein [uncultured Polaribacter sp.]|uniref:T9SS type A sorting domain-containing protein n=1 Tax=uncultured Polaribacter sp. TaxID=174711 RepID=UPI00259BDD4D|nr:T9SS type A sorting domain-containing protein [uncultured Polaribacter sp.]
MKTILYLAIFFSAFNLKAQEVFIPDANFKAYLLANNSINLNKDSKISISEANNYSGTISVKNKGITNLKGIEEFINITTLRCDDNFITDLDLSKNVKLTNLICRDNYIKNINLSNNKKLREVNITNNKITNITIVNNTDLEKFYADENELTSINFLSNIKLNTLYVSKNKLKTIDVSNNVLLREFYCNDNEIVYLNVTKNPELKSLYCQSNKILHLNISKNTVLTKLNCSNNQLGALNIANSNNSSIQLMNAKENQNLSCIQIDANFTPTANFQKDITSNFDSNCGIPTTNNPNGSSTCFDPPVIKYFKGFYQTTEWMKTGGQKMGNGLQSMFYRIQIPQNSNGGLRTLNVSSCKFDSSKGTLYVAKGDCDNLNQDAKFAKSCSGGGVTYYNGAANDNTTYTIEWNSDPQGSQIDAAADPFFWEWEYNGPEACEPATINDIQVDRENGKATITFTENGNNGNYQIYLVEEGEYPLLGDTKKVVGASPAIISGLKKNKYYKIYISAPCSNSEFQSGFGVYDNELFNTFSDTMPENDTICDAIEIELDKPSVSNAFVNLNATTEINEPTGSCFNSNAEQTVWFQFIAPTSGKVKITTDLNPQGTNDNTEIALYKKPTNCSDASTLGAALACNQDGGTVGDGNNSTIIKSGLTPGERYYVQVGGSTDGSFGLEIHTLPADTQTEAVLLPIDNPATEYSLADATYSGINTSCGTPILDYWISIIAPESGKISINVITNTLKTAKIDIYEIVNNVLTSLGVCGDGNLSFKTSQTGTQITGLTPGKQYYIMVFPEVGKEFNSFSLEVKDANTLSTSLELSLENLLSIYPNPAKENLQIEMKNSQKIDEVQIFSVVGKRVLKINVNTDKTLLNTSKLSKGIYILKAKVNNKIISKKLIIN